MVKCIKVFKKQHRKKKRVLLYNFKLFDQYSHGLIDSPLNKLMGLELPICFVFVMYYLLYFTVILTYWKYDDPL